MTLTITHNNNKIFTATTAHSNFTINPDIISPLEYFIAGLIGCSGVDIANLSRNDNTTLEHFSLTCEGERQESFPQKFTSLHFIYTFEGTMTPDQVRKWVSMSLTTYCSTINTLYGALPLYYSISLNHQLIITKHTIEYNKTKDYATLETCSLI